MRIDEMLKIWGTCCALPGDPPGLGNSSKFPDRQRTTQRPHTPKTCVQSSHGACCDDESHADRIRQVDREFGQHNRLNAVETRSKKLAKTRSLDQFWPMPIGVNKARGDKTKEVDALCQGSQMAEKLLF